MYNYKHRGGSKPSHENRTLRGAQLILLYQYNDYDRTLAIVCIGTFPGWSLGHWYDKFVVEQSDK